MDEPPPPLEPEPAPPPAEGALGAPVEPLLPASTPEPSNERKALGVCALIALALGAWIIQPVAFGIFLGALNAFMMQSLYEGLKARQHRSARAAAATVAISTLALLGALVLISYLLVSRGVVLASALIASLSPGGEGRRRLEPLLGRVGLRAYEQELLARLHSAASELAARAAGVAAAVASTTFGAILTVVFGLLTTHFVLRHWVRMTGALKDMLPLHPRHTRALLEEIRKVGRATLLGTLVTGLAQGILAGIGYAIGGLQEPAFFGAATAVTSLVPAVGTLVVWVPAGIYLVLFGHLAGGIFVLVWGAAVVVTFSDSILRPKLVGLHGQMPALLTLASLFGGLEVLGLPGLLVGPVVMAFAVAALRIYAAESAGRSARRSAEAGR